MMCKHDALYGNHCLRCDRVLGVDEYLAASTKLATVEYAAAEEGNEDGE